MKKITISQLADFFSARFGVVISKEDYNSEFSEIGIDSLSIFSTIDDLEKDLECKISDQDLFDKNSIQKLFDYLEFIRGKVG